MDKETMSKIVKNEGSLIEITDEGLNINCNDFEIIHREKKNNKLIDFLNYEESQLIKRIQKAREEENFGTYKNLIQALVNVSELLDKKDWKMGYSEYTTDDNKQVAIWEQNGEGNIRNHKVWNVDEETKDKINKQARIMGIDCAFASNNKPDKIYICVVDIYDNANKMIYEKELTFNTDKNSATVIAIKDMFYKFNVDKIVIDKCGFGIVVYDSLINTNIFKDRVIETIERYPRNTNCMYEFIQKTFNFGYFSSAFSMLNEQMNNIYIDDIKNGIVIFNFKDKTIDMGLYYALRNIAVYVFNNKEIK